MTNLSQGQLDKLKTIVDATRSERGFTYLTKQSAKLLVDAGYAECNEAMTNPDSPKECAVRATTQGTEYLEKLEQESNQMNTTEQAEVAQTPAQPGPASFTIESNVPVPQVRRSAAQSKYPFDALEVGQSFFVPATPDNEDPAKSLGSTVSTAQKRYADIIGKRTITRKKRGGAEGETETVSIDRFRYHRKFIVRSTEQDEVHGLKGARVFRIPLDNEAGDEDPE